MKQHNSCRDKEVSILDIKNTHRLEIPNISNEPSINRYAVASGKIIMNKNAFNKLKTLPKGDTLTIAEIAGIQATKHASDIIPLSHPILLDKASITITLNDTENSVTVTCTTSATAKTGVEMEALAGVNGALLTLYHQVKDEDTQLTISDIHLEIKEDSKNGLWINPNDIKKWEHLTDNKPLSGITTAIVTLSDRASKGTYKDLSGPAGTSYLQELGANIHSAIIIPDEKDKLEDTLTKLSADVSLIITTGGTGVSPRDITPEVLQKICHKILPGFGEKLRQDGSKHTKFAWISRSIAGIYNKTLIISLPGNPKAVKEGIEALQAILPHTIEIAQQETKK